MVLTTVAADEDLTIKLRRLLWSDMGDMDEGS